MLACMYVYIEASILIRELPKITTDRPYKNEASSCCNILALLQSYIEFGLKNVI